MKQKLFSTRLLFAQVVVVSVIAWGGAAAQADGPATAPATQPALADTPEVKAVRDQLLEWDINITKMSLVDFRKTFHTENEREAIYADYIAHVGWELGMTEQAVRDKWGPEGDVQFARLMGFTTREEDQACEIKVDGGHAVATWAVKGMKPEKLIKVDGHWQNDVHAMWDDWIAENPNIESEKRPMTKVMKQMRADIADGKYDDADSCLKDLQTKLKSPEED